ncbi:MAG: pentapeptide repeat-containing protein [Pseudanabaenaceae cyanobacterium]
MSKAKLTGANLSYARLQRSNFWSAYLGLILVAVI